MKSKILLVGAVALASTVFSACQKDFDPSSYAPKLSINGYTSTKEIATSSLIAKWSFDGNLLDSVSNAAGTATGTSYSTGIKGQAFQGATSAYALATPSTAVTAVKSFTLTEWVKTPAPSTGIVGLFSLANTTQFWGNIEVFMENGSTNDNGKLRVHINKGGDKTFAVDNIVNFFDRWTALAVSYDAASSTVKVYVNGSVVKSGTVTGLTGDLAFASSGKVVFGTVQFQTTPSQTSSTGSQSWASFLTGSLDEVRIYNKALTDIEISSLVKLEGRGK